MSSAVMASSRMLQVHGRHRRCGGGGMAMAKRWMGSSGSTSSGGNSQQQSFNSFFAWYSKKLDTHPVTTKCISAGLISSLGNVLAQKITHHQKEEERKEDNCEDQATPFQVDVAQVSRFALLNVAFVAPVLHHWYQFINRSVPGTSMSRVLQRTFWDEFVFSPMYIPVFLGMLWKLEGSSNENIVKMTKSEVPSIIVAEWITWVPTMIVTFRYCPVKFQVLVINVVGVAWQTFLAYMASNAHGKETAEDVVEKVNERDEDGFIQRALPIIATTSSAAEGGGAIRHAADCVATDENATAADCSCVDDESQQHISSSVIVEKKVIPLVLNTLLRRNTPKYVELEYCSMEDEYQ